MLDLNRVATFVQTVQAGSFAAAARLLNLPANTVSRRVQQLEEDLGTRLLHRSTRKLSLTPAGQQFFDRCAASIGDVHAAQQALIQSHQQPTGILRVTAPADFFDHFHLEWLAEFMARYPKMQFEFRLTDTMSHLVAEGIDLAFRGGTLPDSQFVARRLFDVDLILAASPGYLAARGTPVHVADLARHECLTTTAHRTLWRLEGSDGPVEVRVGGAFSANSVSGLQKAAHAGLGIVLLPQVTLANALQEGRLTHVLPQYCLRAGGFHAVYPHREQRAPVAIALVDFFLEKIARFMGSPGHG